MTRIIRDVRKDLKKGTLGRVVKSTGKCQGRAFKQKELHVLKPRTGATGAGSGSEEEGRGGGAVLAQEVLEQARLGKADSCLRTGAGGRVVTQASVEEPALEVYQKREVEGL